MLSSWTDRGKGLNCHIMGSSVTLRPDHRNAGLGRIEIQVRSNQVRSQFLVSCVIKILFAYTRDTFCGSLDTEPVSWFWFADPYFEYRS